jgi:membrane-associated phospholipid phosphatase
VINGLSYTFGGDLFFSGHVAGSFALVLIFRNTQIRYFLFLFHLIVVASAIVGRFHYAIDIVGAYAITYSLFKLTEPWYKNFEKKYLQPN